MTISQLEYILAVDKYRNFGKAAEACCVTQPTLSMQIQKLEEDLGIVIFDRSKKPILPTEVGEKIINQAKFVIRDYNKIKNIVLESKDKIVGDFKLAVIPTLAPYIIPIFAKNFAEQYKDVNLIIEEYKTEDIIDYLNEDRIDAALLVTPLHVESIEEKVLYYEPFYLFVSAHHKLSSKEFIHQDELDLEDIWLLNKGNCFRDQVLNICSEKIEQQALNENLKFESGSFETLKNMVLKHSGYTILPKMAVSQLSNNQVGFVRKFENPVPSREISLVYSRKIYKKCIIDAIQDSITHSLPEEYIKLKNDDVQIVEIY